MTTLQREFDTFAENVVNYTAYIDNIFSKIEFELVLYDEVEYFKQYDDPEFNYPYQ